MYPTVSRSKMLTRAMARAARGLANPARRRYLSIRRAHHDGPRVLANSIPKSGTHLLMKCLRLFPDLKLYHDGVLYPGELKKEHPAPVLRRLRRRQSSLARMGYGCFAMVHWPYSESALQFVRERDIKMVLMIRDPRDMVISFFKFEMTSRRHGYHRSFAQLPDDGARLRAAIAGDAVLGIPDIAMQLERYTPWIDQGICVIRFENLIGEHGGGNRELQLDEIERLSGEIGISLTRNQSEHIADRVFDVGSRTFRKGMIRQWEHEFDDAHRELFKQTAGRFLVELGYEEDMNW